MLFLTVFSLLIGSSTELKEERRCYGGSFTIPSEYTPPHFTGKLTLIDSIIKRVLFEDGKVKNSRIIMSNSKAYLRDLSSLDEGTFVVSPNGGRPFSILTLKIDDCAEQITTHYGSRLSWPIPKQAEHIEFTRTYRRVGMSRILWSRDRGNHQDDMGRMRNDAWEIEHITQDNNGIYNIRAKDRTLLMRKNLTVEGHKLHFYKEANERLTVEFPVFFLRRDVTFTPGGETYPDYSAIHERFKGRLEITEDYMVIDPVESTDTGTFEFTDQSFYPVMSVHLEVKGVDVPTSVFIGIAVAAGIVLMTIIICCCFLKKYSKKSSSQRNELAPQSAAANATYYYAAAI